MDGRQDGGARSASVVLMGCRSEAPVGGRSEARQKMVVWQQLTHGCPRTEIKRSLFVVVVTDDVIGKLFVLWHAFCHVINNRIWWWWWWCLSAKSNTFTSTEILINHRGYSQLLLVTFRVTFCHGYDGIDIAHKYVYAYRLFIRRFSRGLRKCHANTFGEVSTQHLANRCFIMKIKMRSSKLQCYTNICVIIIIIMKLGSIFDPEGPRMINISCMAALSMFRQDWHYKLTDFYNRS